MDGRAAFVIADRSALVVEEDDIQLLEIVPETGRTQQIRVHLSAIGRSLAGDWLYGAPTAVRPMLHAAEIAMTHPVTNEPLTVAASLPRDVLEEAHSRALVIGQEQETRAQMS